MRTAALLIVFALGASPAALAAVYTCNDASGRIVFRDSPCPRGEQHAQTTQAADEKPSARTSRAPRKPSTASPLDRERVERLVARLDGAMAKRNAKAVVALLAQDAVVEMPTGLSGAQNDLDRSAYKGYLARVFSANQYVYRAEPARTSLSKAKAQASVTRQIRETAWLDGRVAVVEVKERLTVEPHGRGLRISALRKEVQAPGRRPAG